jgi:hypothetical protein
VCLSNLENINALFIKEGLGKMIRLGKLNTVAIEQMTILTNTGNKVEPLEKNSSKMFIK